MTKLCVNCDYSYSEKMGRMEIRGVPQDIISQAVCKHEACLVLDLVTGVQRHPTCADARDYGGVCGYSAKLYKEEETLKAREKAAEDKAAKEKRDAATNKVNQERFLYHVGYLDGQAGKEPTAEEPTPFSEEAYMLQTKRHMADRFAYPGVSRTQTIVARYDTPQPPADDSINWPYFFFGALIGIAVTAIAYHMGA